MKKILIVHFFFIATLAFSQSANIQNAYNAYKFEDRDGNKTKIKDAKDYIDLAYSHESTSNHPKMWNYRSKIYLEIMKNHASLDEKAVFKATEAHIRCLDRDKKGRISVRKWTAEEEVLTGLIQCGYLLFNSGVEDYNNKNYQDAINKYEEIFNIIPLDKDDLLKRGNIVPDVIYKNLFLAALQLKDVSLQINYLEAAIDLNTNDPDIYAYISRVYSEKGELDKALYYVREGIDLFDSEISLINTEIDLLLKMGESNMDIIEKITQAIELSDNDILFIIRSNLFLEEGMYEEAEKDLLEALLINPMSETGNNNLASLYLLQVEQTKELKKKVSYKNTKRIEELQGLITDLRTKSVKYLSTYVEIKISNDSYDIELKEALNALKNTYFYLGLDDKSKEAEDLLNSF